MADGSKKLELARKHLNKVQAAWDEPTDWDDLYMYGLYCLEAAVDAALLTVDLPISRKHWEKADLAVKLHEIHGLPDVSQLLRDLNEGRKVLAYDDIDIESSEISAEDLSSQIEEFVEEVDKFINTAS
jgi:uncharacterized protein YutE (UPF0331/DUF86 family)